jgi:glutathione S-transferase
MNPQHTIPTLDDNGFYLNESRAMLQYLANKYGKDDNKLYPKDPQARAQVDMKLFFDMGTLYFKFGDAYVSFDKKNANNWLLQFSLFLFFCYLFQYPAIFGKTAIDEAKLEKFSEALGFLEEYLTRTTYVAANHLTIADYALAATLSTIEASGHDLTKFQKITAYITKLKEEIEGYQELNQEGADQFGAWAKGAIAQK